MGFPLKGQMVITYEYEEESQAHVFTDEIVRKLREATVVKVLGVSVENGWAKST
jgi:hypothetical protein